MNYNIPSELKGLTLAEIEASRAKHGDNRTQIREKNPWYALLLDILKEPMLILLIAVSILYLILGEYGEAGFMFGAIVVVSAISFYQDSRSQKALEELKKLNEPLSRVIRDSKVVQIPTEDIVVGDLCMAVEGSMVNADGEIVYSNDFSVNESALTGETYSVFKNSQTEDNKVFSGTIVVSGMAVFRVEAIGAKTRLGKIGESLAEIKAEKSPLQKQINRFVKIMAIIGVVIFLMICVYNYVKTGDLLASLMVGLTLAMSVLPEEIPVAFTTFMALGAWKLMRQGIIVKRTGIVETLGSTTVICSDKTGTITENSMILRELYDFKTGKIYYEQEFDDPLLSELIEYGMWGSEPVPFDPMEKALHTLYDQTTENDIRRNFNMVYEYALGGTPPMMTHIYADVEGNRIIAAKGAPEALIQVSKLDDSEKKEIRRHIKEAAEKGYRLLGVAKSDYDKKDFPKEQQEFPFEFLGLLIFYDPPKPGIKRVFEDIYTAGIQPKVVTGDNADTTRAIARQAGIENGRAIVEGVELKGKTIEEIIPIAEETVLFARMFPDAKLSVIRALQQKGEIVAMLGDGVNDAPALKASDIGVAMGHKGTEIAKAAADLVLTDDNLDSLITAIAAGRRIYANIKKAIQYVISIHIPIILTVSLPLFLGWIYPEIFTPVHVIFLELIMGPTCSIVYENEPMEKNTMIRKPRKMSETFLSGKELMLSIVQGLAITAGVLFAYRWTSDQGGSEELTRAMVFTTLIFSNVLLSLTNRSFYYSFIESFGNKNPLMFIINSLAIGLLMLILYFEPLAAFFSLTGLNLNELAMAAGIAVVSVFWFEIWKLFRRFSLAA